MPVIKADDVIASDGDEKSQSEKKNEELLDLARERMKIADDAETHIKASSLSDMEFVFNVRNGQWDDDIRSDREDKERVMVTINKLKKLVNIEIGKNRQNRLKPKVQPADADAEKADTARIFNGIIRNIEYQSSADIAYDTAYKHQLSGGFGYFRVITQFEEGEFNQVIKIRRIKNPSSVTFDPEASEFDYSDAQYCFIDSMVSRKAFEAEYPGVVPMEMDLNTLGKTFEGWFLKDQVRVAEYFYKVPTERTLALLGDDSVMVLTEETRKGIADLGKKIVKERKETVEEVWWTKLIGNEVIETPRRWTGKFIPVIPVLGEEIWVDGKKYLLSMIKDAKDPQRLYNYWEAMAAEMVALAPKAPFIMSAEQVEGYEREWQNVNTDAIPYLLYNFLPDQPKPQREPQTQIPSAIVQRSAQANFDIKDTTGKFEASTGEQGNERSGKAIEKRAQVSDLGSFLFPDNMRRSVQYLTKILIDLIPKIYDTERIVRIVDEEGKVALEKINQTGGLNDLSVGKFAVFPDSGFYSTKKEETRRDLIELQQYAPDSAPVLAPRIARMLDFDDAESTANELEEFYSGQLEQRIREELLKEQQQQS